MSNRQQQYTAGAEQRPHSPSPPVHQSPSRAKRILIVAGEESGDKHAAKLIAGMKRLDPGITVYAAGGRKMEAAGARLLFNLVDMAVLGSVEVLKNYFALRKVFYSVISFVEEKGFDAVVLVDYPGFNIRLAKQIKKRRLPAKVIYYISPQVWAWGTRRKGTIARVVDKMIVILPFEKEFYGDTPLDVEFVGHPMIDDLVVSRDPREARRDWGLDGEAPLVALLPGSRWNEVRRHLPVMLKAAELIRKKMPGAAFVMRKPPERYRGFTERAIASSSVKPLVVSEGIYDIISVSRIVIVASGTATLETACLLRPMVIIYKVAWPTYFLGRMLVKLSYIGLVNVIAGRKIMPEMIQSWATPEKISAAALEFLSDSAKYDRAVGELRGVRRAVGGDGASARAAEAVIRALGSGKDILQ